VVTPIVQGEVEKAFLISTLVVDRLRTSHTFYSILEHVHVVTTQSSNGRHEYLIATSGLLVCFRRQSVHFLGLRTSVVRYDWSVLVPSG